MKDIVIVGAGGLACEVMFLINEINRDKFTWNILGLIANEESNTVQNIKVIGDDTWLECYDEPLCVAFAIGNPEIVKCLFQRFESNKNLVFPNLIHPNVIGDWGNIAMGRGNIICAFTSLTTAIEMGDVNIINPHSAIAHHSKLGSFNLLLPRNCISGNVQVQDTCTIGAGATILQGVEIVSNTIIGAQSLVTKSIDIAGTYVGIPAKKIK
jgi:sugar O-acyltransferase (sialic acid O-acetyltransferase NeuD family)